MHRSPLSMAIVALLAAPAAAQSWGDLSLRIAYDSDKLPGPGPVPAAAGVAFCGGLPLVDDRLLVHPKDRGVANVFVYLFEPDARKVPVHASYQMGTKDEVEMANKNCAFVPKAVAMHTSQTFVGLNPDPIGHSMKLDPFNNVGFNEAIAAGGELTKKFTSAEATPIEVTCTSHPWMKGWVLIREDPYFAISDASGKVTIKNLPAGKWAFRVWHERTGFIDKGSLAGKPVEWLRGRITWDIKPGKNDLGELLVKPGEFK